MRFSLLSMILLTAVAGGLCCVFFALPPVMTLIALFMVTMTVIPAAAVSGLIYGKGYRRAFSIGVLASMSWLLIGLPIVSIYILASLLDSPEFVSPDSEPFNWIKLLFAVAYVTAFCGGLLSMGIRWLCLRRAATSSTTKDKHNAPSTELVDARDSANVYAVLQGRISSQVPAPAANASQT